MTQGLLPRRLALTLVRCASATPKTVVAGAVVAWIVAGVLIARVKVETDILSLVPQNNRVISDFKTTVERFGSVDTLLVVIRIGPDKSLEPVIAYADVLAESLREWEYIDWVQYRLEDSTETILPLLDRVCLLLSPEQVAALLDRLDSKGIAEQARLLRSQLMTPQSMVMKDIIKLDPMGLLPGVIGRVRLGDVGASFDPETGVLTDRKRRYLLMLAKPVRPAQDIQFNKLLANGLEQQLAAATNAWRSEGWEGAPPRVEFTGGYIISLQDSDLIIGDLVVGIVGSLLGVMTLFLLAFRRRAAVVYAFFPLVTGLGLTFCFAALVLGRLNSATTAFAALLIGLGIDFIIVLYGRYVEERNAGADHLQAIEALGTHTGVGVLLGAVTTAATFYAFLVTDFRGLSELGLLTGTGILLLVTTVFLLLPALLTLLQHRRKRSKILYLHSFGTDILCRASMRHPWRAVIITSVLTLLMGTAMLGLDFDDDIRNMRSPDNKGIKLRKEVMEAFGIRFTPMMVRIDAPDEVQALAKAQEMLPYLEGLVDMGVLARVETIAGVMPPLEQQRQVITMLASRPIDPQWIHSQFAAALAEEGMNPRAFAQGIDHLTASLQVREPLQLTALEGTTLERVVERYLVEFDGGVSTVIYCYPPAGKGRRAAPAELKAVMARFPDAVLAGTNVVSEELRRIVWGDAARAAVLGMVLVFVLLWADLGSPGRSLLTLVPLLVGMVFMLGTMALAGLQVNFMNVFVLTMIIGIGVDYGIHLLHRWEESDGEPAAVSETAKAIAVAALTTMVGFGSLVLSHYPGLKSVGAAAILGGFFTCVLSITLLPALLQLRKQRQLARLHRPFPPGEVPDGKVEAATHVRKERN